MGEDKLWGIPSKRTFHVKKTKSQHHLPSMMYSPLHSSNHVKMLGSVQILSQVTCLTSLNLSVGEECKCENYIQFKWPSSWTFNHWELMFKRLNLCLVYFSISQCRRWPWLQTVLRIPGIQKWCTWFSLRVSPLYFRGLYTYEGFPCRTDHVEDITYFLFWLIE